MPNYVSHEGEFHPAKEKVGLINKSDKTITVNGKKIKPGEPFIYEGPCREAIMELSIAGVDHFGHNFRHDNDFLQAIRTMGFADVDDYLSKIGYDSEKVKKDFEKKAEVVQKHDLPKRVKEIKMMGGGVDTSGSGNDVMGGLGNAPHM